MEYLAVSKCIILSKTGCFSSFFPPLLPYNSFSTWLECSFKIRSCWDFTGGPAVRHSHFHWRCGHGFDPSLGNEDSICCVVWPKDNLKKIRTCQFLLQNLPIPLKAVTLKIVFRLFRGRYLEDFRMAQGSTYIVGCPTTQPPTKLGCLGLRVIELQKGWGSIKAYRW